MTTRDLILWIERGLLAIGVTLGAWCGAVLLEARFFQQLPVTPAATASTLPGETPRATSPRPTPIAVGSWLARLEAPSVKLQATVLEGTDDGTLARGAGHIEETAFPGGVGNVGIAGHRDTTFRPVRHLRVGDPLVITTTDRVFRYKISRTTIVDPEDVYVLDDADHPTLTLVTCYPFEYIGHAPRRFIVSADLVGEERREPDRVDGAGKAGQRPTYPTRR
jgi:sortase A